VDTNEVLVPSWAQLFLRFLSELILEKLDVWFVKSDCLILLPLGIGPYLSSDIYLLALGLTLLHCNLFWTLFHILFRSVIS
jgi:hypothetical protein